MPNEHKPQPEGSRHYSPRIDVHEEVRLIDGNGTIHDVILADISREGFRVKYAGAAPPPGIARLRGGRYADVPIEVRWIRGGEAGGVFLEQAPDLR
jgi:hypothetical protein